MQEFDPRREWSALNYEIFYNKPSATPYPTNIARRRKLLLKAQVILADYQIDKIHYLELMDRYYNWRT